jgi:hypothetical protein
MPTKCWTIAALACFHRAWENGRTRPLRRVRGTKPIDPRACPRSVRFTRPDARAFDNPGAGGLVADGSGEIDASSAGVGAEHEG